jgi:hypothetical protein
VKQLKGAKVEDLEDVLVIWIQYMNKKTEMMKILNNKGT